MIRSGKIPTIDGLKTHPNRECYRQHTNSLPTIQCQSICSSKYMYPHIHVNIFISIGRHIAKEESDHPYYYYYYYKQPNCDRVFITQHTQEYEYDINNTNLHPCSFEPPNVSFSRTPNSWQNSRSASPAFIFKSMA